MAKKKQTLTNLLGVSDDEYFDSLTAEQLERLDGFIKAEPGIWLNFRWPKGDAEFSLRELFTPLEFFELVEEESAYLLKNRNRPILVLQRFRSLNLTEEQKWFLCALLNERFEGRADTWACLNELKRRFPRTEWDEPLPDTASLFGPSVREDFIALLEDLPDHVSRLKFLIEEKAFWLQRCETDPYGKGESFEDRAETKSRIAEWFNLEIQKISDLIELERENGDRSEASTEEEAEGAKLLAKVCPSFAKATPETRRKAWGLLQKFTRKQWAYFADRTSILSKKPKTERAKELEAISKMTNLRDLFGKDVKGSDRKIVDDVLIVLKADEIKAKTEQP